MILSFPSLLMSFSSALTVRSSNSQSPSWKGNRIMTPMIIFSPKLIFHKKKIILITPSLDTLKDRSRNRRWFPESVLWIRRNRDLIWFRDRVVVRIKSGGRVINERRGRKSICEIPAVEGSERRTWDQDRMKSIRVAMYTRIRYHESIYRATPGSRGLCAVLLIDRRN